MAIAMAVKTKEDFLKTSVEDVLSVYSGKDGKCCCGCSGKHTYGTHRLQEVAKSRGYSISDDEVNDREVKRILNIVRKSDDSFSIGSNHVSCVVGKRLYIVYFS